jgi:toxin-antitoxin system PIN domain toxin
MRIVDANLLVYAYVSVFPQHDIVRQWMDERLNAPEPLGLPWPSLLAFVRLVSNPRVFAKPQSADAAWRQASSWLACPCVWIPQPTERHRAVLDGYLSVPGLRANHVPDAHLAALAVEHGLVLSTSDTGYSRFPGLRVENPILV